MKKSDHKEYNPKPIGPGSEGVHAYTAPDKKITTEMIEEAIDYVFNKMPEPQRRMRILASCKTFGTTDLETRVCDDLECGACSTFNNLVKEQVKE